MKKFILTSVFLLVFSFLYSQIYNMSNGTTINTCSGTFYDAGGSSLDYNNNETFTRTFCSNLPGSEITFDFSMFNSEQCCDHLYIYDGPTTTGNLLIQAEGINPPALVGQSFTSSNGCLTISWISDGSVINSGWIATISCSFPCQPFQLQVLSSIPVENNNIVLCDGNSVQFTANGSYPNNNNYYYQSDSSSVCKWYINNLLVHTGFSYNITSINGTHDVLHVVLRDINNCTEEQYFTIFTQDYLNIIQAPANLSTYWVGQNISLFADSIISITSNEIVSDSTPMIIPDGQGTPFEKDILVNVATPGAVIQSALDITSICLNMEHSYLGDLDIWLICPNGQYLNIFTYPDGLGSTWFGVPIDDDSNTNPGIGYTYCWTPGATNPVPNMSSQSVPAGNYQPTGPFSDLLGCPINGNWKIHIEDHLGSDNGYLFQVDLTFDASVITPNILDTLTNCNWNGANIISSTNITATAQAVAPGAYTYSFSAMNSCGDTLVQYVTVNVIDTPAFVSGRVFLDQNQDCINNSGDINQINRIVEFSPGGYFASTDTNGFYMAAIPQGNYTVLLASSSYISNLCPVQHSYSVLAVRGDTLTGINFADTLIPYIDMEVFLGSSIAVLGNDVTFNILISNHGNVPNSGVLHVKTDSSFLFISCSGSGTCADAGNGKVNFNYPAIQPGTSLLLEAVFYVPVNTNIIGDYISSLVWLDSIPTDINLQNNIDSVTNFIYASYDPNLKTVMPVGEGQYGYILATDSILKYTIHFQNTGNWPATDIVIKDTLSAFVDPATIEPGPSSHPYTFNLSGQGIAEFRFMNIMLPDSSSNQNESHGYVCYRIKQRNNSIGTQILNTGNIYFDYNPLVATNTALNIIMAPLQVSAISENKFQKNVYPNPVNNSLFVDHLNAEKNTVIEISSVTGNLIASYNFNNITIAEIPMKKLSTGVYIIKIITENSIEVRRVVKL